jgi:hypothetical protein
MWSKTIGDDYRIYSLIIILNARIVASVRCGLFKMSPPNHAFTRLCSFQPWNILTLLAYPCCSTSWSFFSPPCSTWPSNDYTIIKTIIGCSSTTSKSFTTPWTIWWNPNHFLGVCMSTYKVENISFPFRIENGLFRTQY